MMDIEKIKASKSTEELIRFGIINIDKPTGPTSFQVSQYVKDSLGINKTSHLGTLDPMVTGVLPIALSRACRLNDYLMHKDKIYVGIMRLHEDVLEEVLNKFISQFIGKIIQLPPVRSRVKRAERVREIKSFKIIERNGKDVLFYSEVQAGTYIRKLIHDLGEKIGGAHMTELRRIKASLFSEESSVNLYDFDNAIKEYEKGNDSLLRKIIIPGEIISLVMPVIEINKDSVKKCLTGSPIFNSSLSKKVKIETGEKICVFSNDKFIGCYNVTNQGDVLAVPEFVFN